jgi:hypothetical protein
VRIQCKRSNEKAVDLVQGFFTALIGQSILADFDPSKVRFRTYLKACPDNFVMKQDESAHRLQRGGGLIAVRDFDAAGREPGNRGPCGQGRAIRGAYAIEEIHGRH